MVALIQQVRPQEGVNHDNVRGTSGIYPSRISTSGNLLLGLKLGDA